MGIIVSINRCHYCMNPADFKTVNIYYCASCAIDHVSMGAVTLSSLEEISDLSANCTSVYGTRPNVFCCESTAVCKFCNEPCDFYVESKGNVCIYCLSGIYKK